MKEEEEAIRLIIEERNGETFLIPVKKYAHPTDALLGSLPLKEPLDDPKDIARKHTRKASL